MGLFLSLLYKGFTFVFLLILVLIGILMIVEDFSIVESVSIKSNTKFRICFDRFESNAIRSGCLRSVTDGWIQFELNWIEFNKCECVWWCCCCCCCCFLTRCVYFCFFVSCGLNSTNKWIAFYSNTVKACRARAF